MFFVLCLRKSNKLFIIKLNYPHKCFSKHNSTCILNSVVLSSSIEKIGTKIITSKSSNFKVTCHKFGFQCIKKEKSNILLSVLWIETSMIRMKAVLFCSVLFCI